MRAEDPGDARQPPAVLRIVRGNPSDAEIAALTVVLAAACACGASHRPRSRERWGRPADLLRVPLRPGPDAWSATLRQR